MARFLLHHRHEADECGVVFASFRGHESSLRHRSALATCAFGGHAIFWAVEAADESQALGERGADSMRSWDLIYNAR